MASTSKKRSDNDKTTIPEYSRLFIDKYLKQEYGPTPEENERVAGEGFYALVKKLQEAGNKDDVKVPLRVLRDEIGRVFFASAQRNRAESIVSLFKLYDAVEDACQQDMRSEGDAKSAHSATQVLEDLRDRFTRLAVGETWEAYPDLRYLALKRMYTYAVKEAEAAPKRTLPSPNPALGRTFSKKMSRNPTSSTEQNWQTAINDLAKAPAGKLLPLLKLLLGENAALAKTLAAQDKDALKAAAEKAAADAEAERKQAAFNLDDLLGLDDPPAPGGEEPPSSAPPHSAASSTLGDPFKAFSEPNTDTPREPFSATSSGIASPAGSGNIPFLMGGGSFGRAGPSGNFGANLPPSPGTRPGLSIAQPGSGLQGTPRQGHGTPQAASSPSQQPPQGGFGGSSFGSGMQIPSQAPAQGQGKVPLRLPLPSLGNLPHGAPPSNVVKMPALFPGSPGQGPSPLMGGAVPERKPSGALPPQNPVPSASEPEASAFEEFNPFGITSTASASDNQNQADNHQNGFGDNAFGDAKARVSSQQAPAAVVDVPKPLRAPPAPPANNFSAWG